MRRASSLSPLGFTDPFPTSLPVLLPMGQKSLSVLFRASVQAVVCWSPGLVALEEHVLPGVPARPPAGTELAPTWATSLLSPWDLDSVFSLDEAAACGPWLFPTSWRS